MKHLFVANTTRLTSLDVFRGLTIFAMLIVCNLGELSNNYSFLLHSAWDHTTPADLIFPFFLFIVGVALSAELQPYIVTASEDRHLLRDRALYKRLTRRLGILAFLGLLLNAFPEFNFITWRIPGTLQRVAICYFVAALIFVHVPLRWQWSIGGATLVGYAALLCFVGAPGVVPGNIVPMANLPRWVDLAVFSSAHLFDMSPTDPEGLLSTPAAVVSVLLGCWIGHSLVNQPLSSRCGALVIASGFIFVGLSWTLSSAIPMIKIIWTPTYALFAGGWAMVCFGLCYLFFDVRSASAWTWVQVFGRNAILSYVLSEIASDTLSVIDMHGTPFSIFVTNYIVNLSGGLVSPKLGSLLYASLLTFAIWGICYILYQRRWFIRV